MSDDHLLIERRDNGVVVATLNRPEVLNALSSQIRSGLREMTADLRGDPDVRLLVITGAGRGFCSGADLSNRDERVAAENEPGLTSTELRYGFAAELQQLEIPVIAAVNGAAAGAGASSGAIGTQANRMIATIISRPASWVHLFLGMKSPL